MLDLWLNNFFLQGRTPSLVRVAFLFTTLGDERTVIGLFLLLSFLFFLWYQRTYIVFLLVSLGGSTVIATLLKHIVHRPRPEHAVYLEQSFSFPSGHATIAVALYGCLLYLLLPHVHFRGGKIVAWIIGGIIVLGSGWSRMELGVHYLSDVLAGYVLGGVWLWVTIYCMKKLHSRSLPPHPAPLS